MSDKFEKTVGEKVNSRWEIIKPLTNDTGQALNGNFALQI